MRPFDRFKTRQDYVELLRELKALQVKMSQLKLQQANQMKLVVDGQRKESDVMQAVNLMIKKIEAELRTK